MSIKPRRRRRSLVRNHLLWRSSQIHFDDLGSYIGAAAAANAVMEKRDENFAMLMSCFELGEKGWIDALPKLLESAGKAAASLPESNLATTVASLRKELESAKVRKSRQSGKKGGQEGATGAGDGKKDGSIPLRPHFHVRFGRYSCPPNIILG